MKTFVAVLALVIVIGSVLLASSGAKTSNENRLTVEQLAELMEFHAWNLPIPRSLQPMKQARLLFVRSDGTETLKFEAGNHVDSATSIYLGFQREEGLFKGGFHIHGPKGQDKGWRLEFKDNGFRNFGTNAGSVSFVTTGEAPVWRGNRAELCSTYKHGGDRDTSLVLELVK
jgi:hypothetical protein